MRNCGRTLRPEYPIFDRDDSRGQLVYLDSAATALKPRAVINAVVDVLANKTANVHRSVHSLGDLATEAFESSRRRVADFIGADAHEIVFVRNTTEAVNLVASSWPKRGACLVSLADHHSNQLPWQGDVRRLKPCRDGTWDSEALVRELRRGDVEIVAVTHTSNVLGCTNPIAEIAALCHEHGALLLVDAAQAVPHMPIDVFDLNCDFLAFSGHKLGGPTGAGVLFGKAELLEQIDWYQRGGSTVEQVHELGQTPKDIPWRLEAGTPAIESVVGLGSAIQFLQSVGMEPIHGHQENLVRFALDCIQQRLPSIQVLGPIDVPRSGPISMVQRAVSPHILARGLSDGFQVCVRSGFQCAQPLHEFLGVPASLRMSFYLYNTEEEIELAIDALARLIAIHSL